MPSNRNKVVDTSGMTQVTPTPQFPFPNPNPSADPGFSPLALGPIPPVMGTAADAARQFYRLSVSQVRMPPLPAQAAPSVGAQIQSHITDVVQEIIDSSPEAFQINDSSTPGSTANFNSSVPAIPAGDAVVIFQDDNGTPTTNISAYIKVFGASGTNHAPGAVPDPGASAGTTRFLREDATWDVPSGGGSNYQTVQKNGVSLPQEAKLNILSPLTAVDDSGNGSSDVGISVFGASGSSHSTGAVPDPGSTAGTGRYLREDATFDLPDGLTHGSSPWEIDSTSVILTEDFASGTNSNGQIGALGWGISTGTGNTYELGAPPHIGIVGFQTGTSQTAPNVLWPYSFNNSNESAVALLDYPGWKLSWVWRWVRKTNSVATSDATPFTKCAFYAGLMNINGFSASRPPIFIGAQYDTDALNATNGTRAIADSTIKLAAFANNFGTQRKNELAIPVIQTHRGSVSSGSGTTATCTMNYGYQKYSSLVVCIAWAGSTTISTVKDNLSNTYTLAETVSNGTAISTAIYYATSLASCTSQPQVTVTFSGNTVGCVSMYELGGTIALDQVGSGTGNSTAAATSGSVTNTSTAELGFCAVGSVIDSLPTAGTGWLMDQSVDATGFGFGSESIQTNQNTSVDGLATVGNGNWAIALATFYASTINLYDTGWTPTEGQWYRLDISCATAGEVTLTISSNGSSKTATFTIPVYTTGTLVETDSSGTAQAGNGQAEVQPPTSRDGTNYAMPWVNGSQVMVSGFTSSYAVLNGLQTVYAQDGPYTILWFQTSSTLTEAIDTPSQAYGYPAFFPAVSWGVDSTSGAASNYCSTQVDFFGFCWNPALATAGATLNSGYSRYVTGS
jgi:hypothetical protein